MAAVALVAAATISAPLTATAAATTAHHPSKHHPAKPHLTRMSVSRMHVPSRGGTIHVSAQSRNVRTCRLTIAPALPHAPAAKSCRGQSHVHWRVHLPRNVDVAALTYRIALRATGAHHAVVTRHRTVVVGHAPSARLRNTSLSNTAVGSHGGSVRIAANVTNARRCELIVAPRIQGFPQTKPCAGSAVDWWVSLPPNPTSTAITYRFAIHASGLTDYTAVRNRSATVAAASPACPGVTNGTTPTSAAFFNDPTSASVAAHDAVVNAMINLVCSASPPHDGVVTSINLAMYLNEIPDLDNALIWAHKYRSAAVTVALDGGNTLLQDSSGAISPNPAYQQLVAGLPAGSVLLCGADAGTSALPPNAEIRRSASGASGTSSRSAAAATATTTATETSCAGDNILHTKLVMVSSVDPAGDPAVLTSSQNLTTRSEVSGFNNGLQIVGSSEVYDDNAKYFGRLLEDHRFPQLGHQLDFAPASTAAGQVTTEVFPDNNTSTLPPDDSYVAANDGATDTTAGLLKSVKCSQPGSYAGESHGGGRRTTVRLAVYSFQKRNLVATRLADLAKAGCDVQVIYTSMLKATMATLKAAGISPVQFKDSSYPLADGTTGPIFLHDKYLLISGAIASSSGTSRNQDIVQTGSQNLTQLGLHHNDEQIMRVEQTATSDASSTALFNAYDANWSHLLDIARGIS